jgi:hypothetical protein
MNEFTMGIYWYERQLTLRQYADISQAFIKQLKEIHPVFQFLEWVGDRPNNAVKLASDLDNLEGLIYTHAPSKEAIYQKPDKDRTASWDSFGVAGFDMRYSTGKAVPGGRMSVWIGAGRTGMPRFANGVTINFPSRENADFTCKEFFDYDFLKRLLLHLIAFWKPEDGRLTSYPFSEAVSTSMVVVVGWLTYVRDPRATALRNSPQLKNLIFETTPDGGTLISLGRTPIAPDNAEQVEQARRLRQVLIDEGLVKS